MNVLGGPNAAKLDLAAPAAAAESVGLSAHMIKRCESVQTKGESRRECLAPRAQKLADESD